MKRLYIHFTALLLSALVVSAVEPIDPAVLPHGTEQVDIYLLLGQSNMKGRGALPLEQSTDPRIIHMNMGNDQWYEAVHPLHKAGVPDLIDGSDRAGVGPGLAFAQAMLAEDSATRIALVPCAHGGSWIQLWSKGGRFYTPALRRAKQALSDFPEGKARIAGVLWLQGESDSLENRYAVYDTKLTDLVQRLRADLNEPELPFVACTIGTFIKPKAKYLYVAEINADLLALPETLPFTACVDARDLKDGHIGDFMHYNTASQEVMGARFAEEFKSLIVKE